MLFQKALIFLFPPSCGICGKRSKQYLCESCLKRIEKYENIKILDLNNKNLSLLIYFFKYEKIIRKLILQFKFFNKPYLSKVFAKIILKNEKFCRKIKFYDIIIPVPMNKEKMKQRGYNQTELVASEIAMKIGIQYEKNLLIKSKNTKMQSKLKMKERYNNVENAFKVLEKEQIKNKNIILVDDIYTTGATLEECAKILKEAGAKNVCGVVIAKD